MLIKSFVLISFHAGWSKYDVKPVHGPKKCWGWLIYCFLISFSMGPSDVCSYRWRRAESSFSHRPLKCQICSNILIVSSKGANDFQYFRLVNNLSKIHFKKSTHVDRRIVQICKKCEIYQIVTSEVPAGRQRHTV